MKAYILIKIRVGAVGEVVRHLRRIEQTVEASMTFGPYDAVAVLQADNVKHLGQILAEAIQPIPGITETLTCLAIDS